MYNKTEILGITTKAPPAGEEQLGRIAKPEEVSESTAKKVKRALQA